MSKGGGLLHAALGSHWFRLYKCGPNSTRSLKAALCSWDIQRVCIRGQHAWTRYSPKRLTGFRVDAVKYASIQFLIQAVVTPNRYGINPFAEKDPYKWNVSILLLMASGPANAFKNRYADSIKHTNSS